MKETKLICAINITPLIIVFSNNHKNVLKNFQILDIGCAAAMGFKGHVYNAEVNRVCRTWFIFSS